MSQWSLFFVIYNGDHHDIIHGVPHTNIIRFEKIDRIRIRILFGLKKSTEYEYEYYSVWKYRPNTNTNIIRLEKITRIRIRILVFGLNYSNNIWIPNYSLTSGPDRRLEARLIENLKVWRTDLSQLKSEDDIFWKPGRIVKTQATLQKKTNQLFIFIFSASPYKLEISSWEI